MGSWHGDSCSALGLRPGRDQTRMRAAERSIVDPSGRVRGGAHGDHGAGAVDGGGACFGGRGRAQPSVGDGAVGDLGVGGGGGARHGAAENALARLDPSPLRVPCPSTSVTIVDGIPVTSAARAVLDLAADKGEAAAETALREMEYLGIYGPVSLPALLDAPPAPPRRRRSSPVCLERLRDDPGGRVRSPLEELFLPFLDAHRIPRPRLNAWLSVGEDRFQVDCLWPDARLVGELDGFQSHGTKRAFRADRKRDRRLLAASYRVVRITPDQLTKEPTQVAADLRVSLRPSGQRLPRSRT